MADDLVVRVERLERECRRWRRGALAALGLAGVVAIGAAARPDDVPELVKARMFAIVDKDGVTKGVFGVAGRDDSPSLMLYDRREQMRAMFSMVRGENPRIGFFDEAGKLKSSLP